MGAVSSFSRKENNVPVLSCQSPTRCFGYSLLFRQNHLRTCNHLVHFLLPVRWLPPRAFNHCTSLPGICSVVLLLPVETIIRVPGTDASGCVPTRYGRWLRGAAGLPATASAIRTNPPRLPARTAPARAVLWRGTDPIHTAKRPAVPPTSRPASVSPAWTAATAAAATTPAVVPANNRGYGK